MGAAYAGFSHLTSWPDRAPVLVSTALPDFISPWYLCSLVIAALDYRRRTAKGLYIDMSQSEAGVTF